MKLKLVKASIFFKCKGWIGYLKPYFITSNSSVVNFVVDKLWILSWCVNGNTIFLDEFLIFFMSFNVIMNKNGNNHLKSVNWYYTIGTGVISFIFSTVSLMLVNVFFINQQHPEAATRGVLWEKMFLQISQNSQKNYCARASFLIKLQDSGLQLYERDSGTGVFQWILRNI